MAMLLRVKGVKGNGRAWGSRRAVRATACVTAMKNPAAAGWFA